MSKAPTITVLQHTASFAGGALCKALALTLRVSFEDRAHFYDPARKAPVILCIWHNRLLGAVLADYRSRLAHPCPLSVLTSASKDGGWLAAVARRFRMGAVRGSSSRRGAAALIELSRHIEGGGDIAITPDGPRGPNYHIAPGLFFLAKRTGAAVVPMEVQLSRYWHIGRRWDALWVPRPFSRIRVVFHEPLYFREGETPDAAAARLDAEMGKK